MLNNDTSIVAMDSQMNINPISNQEVSNRKRNIIAIIVGIVLIFAILLSIGITLLVLLKRKPKKIKKIIEDDDGNEDNGGNENGENEEEYNFQKEDLIVERNYPKNIFFRFSSIKKTEMEAEGQDFKKKNSSNTLSAITDLFFIVREEYLENDIENKIKKNWYTGYIGILNLTIRNETNDTITIYDKTLYEYLNQNNLESLENIDLQYIGGEDGKFCFIKIDFYQNGEVKNYYLPKGFQYINFITIDEFVKIIIPKISSNIYVESIYDSLNESMPFYNDEENEYDDNDNETYYKNETDNETNYSENENENETIYNDNDNETVYSDNYNTNNYNEKDSDNNDEEDNIIKKKLIIRNLNQNNNNYHRNYKPYKDYKQYKLHSVKHSSYERVHKRKLSEDTNDTIDENTTETINYYLKDVDVEEYFSTPLTNSTNLDFREANNFNNSKNSNLTELSIKTIENDNGRIEGSQINTTTHILLDKNGLLQSAEEIMTTSMTSLENNDEDEDDEETILLKKEIYNENNQISISDIYDDNNDKSEEEKNNKFKFNITGIYLTNRHIFNCTNSILKDKLYQQLYNYFDKFSYKLYNLTYDELNEILYANFSHNNSYNYTYNETNNKRNLIEENDNSYYCMKTMTNVKEAYNYNLLGLKMSGNIFSEIQPSTLNN